MRRPILLIEDAENDIEFALLALKRCGVANEVIVARDGEEALDYLLRRRQYQHRHPGNLGLVLLDLKLPVTDGITILRTISATPTLASIPVVVLTGSAMEADITTTIALGSEARMISIGAIPINGPVLSGNIWLL
ncbi:response regulator [Herbaspirillum sp. GCM10030257]|uniref:response regulator n=1 Tax=Herbaspirillum sp. GCM10030257 TaxID=3273393 RepID=UPI003606EF4F